MIGFLRTEIAVDRNKVLRGNNNSLQHRLRIHGAHRDRVNTGRKLHIKHMDPRVDHHALAPRRIKAIAAAEALRNEIDDNLVAAVHGIPEPDPAAVLLRIARRKDHSYRVMIVLRNRDPVRNLRPCARRKILPERQHRRSRTVSPVARENRICGVSGRLILRKPRSIHGDHAVIVHKICIFRKMLPGPGRALRSLLRIDQMLLAKRRVRIRNRIRQVGAACKLREAVHRGRPAPLVVPLLKADVLSAHHAVPFSAGDGVVLLHQLLVLADAVRNHVRVHVRAGIFL